MKNFPRFALAMAGATLASLVLTTACIVTVHSADGMIVTSHEVASRVETHELNLTSGENLRAETPYGNVTVRPATGTSGGRVRAEIQASGEDEAEANRRLSAVKLVIDEAGSGATLRLEVESESTRRKLGGPTVTYEFEVPAGVRLELASSSGNVKVEKGAYGASTLKSSYGKVSVEGVTGDVTAESKSGDVNVAHVEQGSVTAKSGYGNVSVLDVNGTDVRVTSSSGNLRIERVKGRELEAESGYGRLDLRDVTVEASAKASSKSGDVTANHLAARTASLASGYGKVAIDGGSGALELKTSSGNISAAAVEAAVSAQTGYGSVSLDGVFTSLAAASSSGDVRVTARPKSSVGDGWSLSSKYGAVALTAPQDLGFVLSAKTGYGSIDVGYPIEIQPGGLGKDQKQLTGRVNGGGGTVKVETSSGNVAVKPEPR